MKQLLIRNIEIHLLNTIFKKQVKCKQRSTDESRSVRAQGSRQSIIWASIEWFSTVQPPHKIFNSYIENFECQLRRFLE